MSELNVTNTFIKKLTKNIRLKYGKEPSHTEVMELVADALGWKVGPLMHALKCGAVQSEIGSRELIPFRVEPVDPFAEMIRDALSLHKRGSMSHEDIATLMNFVQAPGGLLIVVADRNDDGLQYVASLAKDWQVRIGQMEFIPYGSERETVPLLDELGIPTRRLSHIAVPVGESVASNGRFIMVDTVGSPLNMVKGIEAGKTLPTIVVVNRSIISLLVEASEKDAAYWADGKGKDERTTLVEALSGLTRIVLDLDIVGGRFHRVKLESWADWVASQHQ